MSQLFEGIEKERWLILSLVMKWKFLIFQILLLCWVCVIFEFSDGFVYCSYCGVVDGLRLDFSFGN